MRLLCALLLIACATSAQAAIQTREMPYRSADGMRMVDYFIYNSDKPGIRSGIIMVHEQWGLNDYAKRHARNLAELGYSALAIDMYGESKHTERPQGAVAFMQAATRNANAIEARFLAGLELLRRQPQADPSQIVAIGYCFGGKIILDMARQGLPLAGMANFHSALGTATPASKDSVKVKILVEHSSADSLVPTKDLDALRQELSAAGADYQMVTQDGAKHGFINPDAGTHKGHGLDIDYDRQADRRPWTGLQAFLKDIFGQG